METLKYGYDSGWGSDEGEIDLSDLTEEQRNELITVFNNSFNSPPRKGTPGFCIMDAQEYYFEDETGRRVDLDPNDDWLREDRLLMRCLGTLGVVMFRNWIRWNPNIDDWND